MKKLGIGGALWALAWCIYSGTCVLVGINEYFVKHSATGPLAFFVPVCIVAATLCFLVNAGVLVAGTVRNTFFNEEKRHEGK